MFYRLIKWHDVSDRVLNDETKYETVHEKVQTPSTQGLSPDLEYFAINIPFAEPVVDMRLAEVSETHTMKEDLINGFRTWEITYAIEQRSDTQKKISIEEKEAAMNAQLLSLQKSVKWLAIGLLGTRRQLHSLSLSDTQLDILNNKIDPKLLKVWQNHTTAASKKEAVDTSNPINLDEDWYGE